jgi:hypothetical protein
MSQTDFSESKVEKEQLSTREIAPIAITPEASRQRGAVAFVGALGAGTRGYVE